MRIKKRKKLYESRTTLRNNSKGVNVVKRTCNVQVHWILHGTFGPEKSEVRFIKNVGDLLKNTERFSMYRNWRRKCFDSFEQCSFSKYCLFWCFSQQLNAKNPSQNRHAWYIAVLWHNSHCYWKWNQADKTPSKHKAFFIHKSNFKQASKRSWFLFSVQSALFQARSQVLRFGGAKYIFRGEIFLFLLCV